MNFLTFLCLKRRMYLRVTWNHYLRNRDVI